MTVFLNVVNGVSSMENTTSGRYRSPGRNFFVLRRILTNLAIRKDLYEKKKAATFLYALNVIEKKSNSSILQFARFAFHPERCN